LGGGGPTDSPSPTQGPGVTGEGKLRQPGSPHPAPNRQIQGRAPECPPEPPDPPDELGGWDGIKDTPRLFRLPSARQGFILN